MHAGVAITALRVGCLLNRSRDCTRSRVPPLRVGAMPTLLRVPLPRPRVVFAVAPPTGLSSIIVRLCENVGRFSYSLPASRSLRFWRVRGGPHRALVNRAAQRLGLAALIPRARALVLLAGGTRERGSPAAIAITAPFPGAAIEPVSSLHSDPRAPSGRYAHALRVPFSVEAMRRWRTPDRACGPR